MCCTGWRRGHRCWESWLLNFLGWQRRSDIASGFMVSFKRRLDVSQRSTPAAGADARMNLVRSLYYRNSAAGEAAGCRVEELDGRETEIKLRITDLPAFIAH